LQIAAATSKGLMQRTRGGSYCFFGFVGALSSTSSSFACFSGVLEVIIGSSCRLIVCLVVSADRFSLGQRDNGLNYTKPLAPTFRCGITRLGVFLTPYCEPPALPVRSARKGRRFRNSLSLVFVTKKTFVVGSISKRVLKKTGYKNMA
jgi:hypothetical protein